MIEEHMFDVNKNALIRLVRRKKLGEQSYYLPYGEIFLKIKRDKSLPCACVKNIGGSLRKEKCGLRFPGFAVCLICRAAVLCKLRTNE